METKYAMAIRSIVMIDPHHSLFACFLSLWLHAVEICTYRPPVLSLEAILWEGPWNVFFVGEMFCALFSERFHCNMISPLLYIHTLPPLTYWYSITIHGLTDLSTSHEEMIFSSALSLPSKDTWIMIATTGYRNSPSTSAYLLFFCLCQLPCKLHTTTNKLHTHNTVFHPPTYLSLLLNSASL